MKAIRAILRNMGEALALADAGEMLSEEGKAAVLDRFTGSYPAAPDAAVRRVVVASDRRFSPEIVEQGIALCHDHRALLDLLCVAPAGGGHGEALAEVLPRLAAEDGLDFQVTRRRGDLLAEVDGYLRARRDTLMILLLVGEELRQRAVRYCRGGGQPDTSGFPAVSLFGEAPGT